MVREGWLVDPSNFVGDVGLDDVCPPGVDAARYLNYHEDPGGLSLALGRDAIASVQRIAVPLPDTWDGGWVRDAVAWLGGVRPSMTLRVAVSSARRALISARAVVSRSICSRRLSARAVVSSCSV
ncbi:hypothetical protein ABZY42_13805 [Streptomyces sp. NPDC006622]|uniref:hypothetical protein n=1 Tax=Streptomyces sp. NPDC006622 TaxID=3155459 RepID=UPI0033A85CB5